MRAIPPPRGSNTATSARSTNLQTMASTSWTMGYERSTYSDTPYTALSRPGLCLRRASRHGPAGQHASSAPAPRHRQQSSWQQERAKSGPHHSLHSSAMHLAAAARRAHLQRERRPHRQRDCLQRRPQTQVLRATRQHQHRRSADQNSVSGPRRRQSRRRGPAQRRRGCQHWARKRRVTRRGHIKHSPTAPHSWN